MTKRTSLRTRRGVLCTIGNATLLAFGIALGITAASTPFSIVLLLCATTSLGWAMLGTAFPRTYLQPVVVFIRCVFAALLLCGGTIGLHALSANAGLDAVGLGIQETVSAVGMLTLIISAMMLLAMILDRRVVLQPLYFICEIVERLPPREEPWRHIAGLSRLDNDRQDQHVREGQHDPAMTYTLAGVVLAELDRIFNALYDMAVAIARGRSSVYNASH